MERSIGATAERTYAISRDDIMAFRRSSGNRKPAEAGPLQVGGIYASHLLLQLLNDELGTTPVIHAQSFKFHGAVGEGEMLTLQVLIEYAYDTELHIRFRADTNAGSSVMSGEATLQVYD